MLSAEKRELRDVGNLSGMMTWSSDLCMALAVSVVHLMLLMHNVFVKYYTTASTRNGELGDWECRSRVIKKGPKETV